MPGGVEFDENQGFDPIPEPKLNPPTFGDVFLHAGIAARPGDAAILLGIFALLLISASFYILASAVPPPPQLGSDVLQAGETVPAYTR